LWGSRKRTRKAASGGRKPGAFREKQVPFPLKLLLLAAVAFAVGLLSVNYLIMPLLVHRTGDVSVPDLVGLSADDAAAALKELGLRIRVLGETYDDEVAAGRVVRQDPGSGTSVRAGRAVSVVLSKGPDVAAVPDLEGESLRHARMLLARVGLKEGSVAHSFSPEVPADHVIGSDPPPGTTLKKGEKVSLLVSLGSQPEDYVMPDVRGLRMGEARAALEAAGFTVRIKGGGWMRYLFGGELRVGKQRPLPGKRVRRGDEVELAP